MSITPNQLETVFKNVFDDKLKECTETVINKKIDVVLNGQDRIAKEVTKYQSEQAALRSALDRAFIEINVIKRHIGIPMTTQE